MATVPAELGVRQLLVIFPLFGYLCTFTFKVADFNIFSSVFAVA